MDAQHQQHNDAKKISPKEKFAAQREKQWLPEQLARRAELSWNAKGVWSRLARYAGNDCKCYPYLATLAKEVGLSKTATSRALKELDAAGLINIKLRRGQHRPNVISLLDHEWLRGSDVPSVPNSDVATTENGTREAGDNRIRMSRVPFTQVGRRGSVEGSQEAEGSLVKAGETPASSDLNNNATATTDRTTDNPPVPVGSLSGAVGRVEQVWREEHSRAFPRLPLARWDGTSWGEGARMKELIDLYDEATVTKSVRFTMRNWPALAKKWSKGPTEVPTVGWLKKNHAALVPQGVSFESADDVKAEADQWFRDNPDATRLPDELHERLCAVLQAKEAMQKWA